MPTPGLGEVVPLRLLSRIRLIELVDLIHLAGVGALHQVQDNRRFPLLLSLWAMQGQSEQIRDLIRRNFDGITETNNHVYGTVLEHYGLTMRPPFTLDQLTVVLTGLVQGLAIRSAVDPAAVPLELPDTAPTDNTGSTGGGA